MGKIISINVSKKTGTIKTPVEEANFLVDHGIEGDAHAKNWHRQISLLDVESIAKVKNKGLKVYDGSFAENLTTEGMNLYSLPVGTKLKIGETIQEVTQIGKECHNDGCAVKKIVGDCVMPREGIFTKVIKSGKVKIGDSIEII